MATVSLPRFLARAEAPAPTPMRQPAAKRFNSLQLGRALAALAVVLFHTVSLLKHSAYGFALPLIGPACSGVDFFFVLSGFIIMNAHRRDLGDSSRLGSFLYRRFIRIYPLYLLLTLLTLLAYTMHVGHFAKLTPGVIAKSVLLLPQKPGDRPLLSPGWTLTHEALFYLLFALLICFGPKARTAVLAVAGTLTIASCLMTLPGPYWVQTWLFSPYNLEFAGGCLASLVIVRRMRWALPAGAGLLLASWWITVKHSVPTTNALHMVIWFGLPYFLIVCGATSFEIDSPASIPRPLLAIGDATYSIYLSHFLVLSALVPLLIRLTVPAPVCLVVMPIVAVCLGYLLHVKVERPMLSSMRSLLFPAAR